MEKDDLTGDMDHYHSTALLSQMPRFKNSRLIDESKNTMEQLVGDIHECTISVIMDQFDNQHEICDATLVIYGRELKAHWCVLLGCPYFEAVYRSSLTGVRPDKIILDIAPFERVREAISFLYDAQLQVYTESIKELLAIADYLHMDALRFRCCQALLWRKKEVLNIDNAVQFLWLFRSYGDSLMFRKCLDFICKNFDEVVEQGDILRLTDYSMLEIIENRTIYFLECKKLFLLITKWTEYDLSNRQAFFPQLLRALKPLILYTSDNDLNKTIVDHKLIHDCKELSDVIEELTGTPPNNDLLGCLMVTKRFRNLNIKRIYCAYVIDEDRWINLSTPCDRDLQTLTNNNKIYQIEKDNGYSQSHVKIYDVSTNDAKLVREQFPLARVEEPYSYYDILMDKRAFAVGDDILKLMWKSSGDPFQDMAGETVESHLRIFDKSTGVFNEISETSFRGFLGPKVINCTVSNRYLCVLATQVTRIVRGEFIKNIFFNYDVVTKSVVCNTPPDVNMTEVVYMYEYDNKAVVGEYGSDTVHVLDFSARRITWRRSNDLVIPECHYGEILKYKSRRRDDHSRPFYQLVTYKDSLYSVMNGDENDFRETFVVQYNLLTKQWTHFQQYFGPRIIENQWNGLHFVQMSRELAKCSYKCPHCKALQDSNPIDPEELTQFMEDDRENFHDNFMAFYEQNSDSD